MATLPTRVILIVVAALLLACGQSKQQRHLFGAARPPVAPASWSVPQWYIDNGYGGTSATTCASNSNNCTSATCGAAGSGIGPCKNVYEVVARLGTTEPVFNQATVVEYMSPSNDPLVLTPSGTGSLELLCDQTSVNQVFAGTISGVTNLNRTAGTLLTLTAWTNAAAGQAVVNATHSSTAFVESVAGGVASMVEPQPVNTTWSNGDSVTVYTPMAINLTRGGFLYSNYSSPSPSHAIAFTVANCELGQGLASYNSTEIVGTGADLVNSTGLQDTVHAQPSLVAGMYVTNGWYFLIKSALEGVLSPSNLWDSFPGVATLNGGFYTEVDGPSIGFNDDPQITYGLIDALTVSGPAGGGGLGIGPNSQLDVYKFAYVLQAPQIWSTPANTAHIDVVNGGTLVATQRDFETTFIAGTALYLDGVQQGISQVSAGDGGVMTFYGPIALTPATLDQDAGPAGFGGFARSYVGSSVIGSY